jgi:hypothetical protein
MSKEELYKLVAIFGLYVDRDRWEDVGYEWMRIQHTSFREAPVLLIYKDDGKIADTHYQEELINYLIRLGEYSFKKKLQDLIKL